MEMSEVASQSAQGPFTYDEVHEDMVNEMWSEYLKNVDDYDRRLTDGWKDDAYGVLVFTGLFSAIVASFIIESYKLLSPGNPGSQTVFLLEQISQQLAGFANGTYVQPQPYPSSSPRASIVCVNILWLLSFLLSTTSALFAALVLQWARIYIDLPQTPSVPTERARVRSVLFFGMKKYRMHLAVETAPALLHLSVFLFFIGLVVFFFTIFKMVAVVILIAVGFFGLAYFALTILPCLDRSCPYRTPMSSLWWHIWHTSLSHVARYLHFILRQLHNCLVPLNLGEITTRRQFILTKWLQAIEKFAEKHGKRLKHGFRGTVVAYAREASQGRDIDVEALTWLFQLPGLTEKSKIQKFVASLPGETIIQLLSKPFQDGKVTFRHHLSTLFRSCTPGTASSALDENMRRRRLLVCLNAVHHIAKASIVSPSSRLLNEMRLHFANIALMRPLWADRDPAIRITARSICALFARQLLRQRQLGEGELSWLQEVMDKPSNTIFNEHNNRARVDSMNVDAFVDGVLSSQRDDLPNVLAISFKNTLMVLMNTNSRASVHADTFEEWLSYHIRRIEEENDRQDPGRDNVVDQLRRMSSTSTTGTGTSRPQSISQSQSQSPASGTGT